jgi:hypothetical protein
VLIRSFIRLILLLVSAAWSTTLAAQMPFYTDDTGVTDRRILHFEFFNEYDALQSSQYPNLNQNTANFKLNYGLPHNLELDLDAPYLSIYRSSGQKNTTGMGDTAGLGDVDLGIKWRFHTPPAGSHVPSLASTLYLEFPTGNVHQQLGSGLEDYWLNFIAQEPFTAKTRLTGNFGYLFAGNTSTGVVGIQTTRGHVYTGGLSVVHDFTPRLSLGAEAYGGLADTNGLGKDQLQFLTGGSYQLRDGLSATFAILGGRYEASPRIGGQFGFAVDFPTALRSHH